MSMLASWLLLSLALWVAGQVLRGVKVRGPIDALMVGLVFGVLHWALGWLLFVVLGLATLGVGFLLAFLTRWVVDALLLKLTAALTDRIKVQSFGWAFWAALLVSAIGTVAERLLRI